MHARAVGVEDARDLDLQPVLAAVVEEQGLGAALALVVAAARADRIDVAPVVLRLRMDLRIAVHLGGRGLKNPRLHPLGQAQHVDRAVHAGLGRLHRIELVVHRRGRAGQVVDLDRPRRRAGRSRRDGSPRNADCSADAGDVRACAPVKKLSTQSTSTASLSSRSQRCEPRKPAPPVTSTRRMIVPPFAGNVRRLRQRPSATALSASSAPKPSIVRVAQSMGS